MVTTDLKSTGRSRRLAFLSVVPRQYLAVLLTLLVVCVITALLSPVFFTTTNLINVMRQIAILGIVSSGMAMLMISGGIDLSVGVTISLAGVCTGWVLSHGYGQFTGILTGILVGAL